MLSYIVQRILYMVILLLVLSFVSFVLIELPPGDFLDSLIQQLRNAGVQVEMDQIRELEDRYGLNLPFLSRYTKWMGNLLRGDMGESFAYNQPVTQLIGQRLLLTVTITMLTLVLGLPTVGPLFLQALQGQDMYLAGSLVMLLSALAMIGMLISDLLLVVVDPRIRFEREATA